MTETKLTIRVSREVLDGARRYARRHRTSLTRLVEAYLQRLPEEDDLLASAPAVRRLTGVLSPEASIEDYRSHLEEKYGGQAPGADRP
jgi:hypothetical protein